VLINYSLRLPRDALTVPVVRRLCKGAMVELGVVASHIHDVSLAVTEACANVIEHSSDTEDQYEVVVALSEERCEIRVIDTGRFDSRPEKGTVVHLQKELAFEDGSLFRSHAGRVAARTAEDGD
jgi:anti-sigma regulatory factor (Ser/Thr protein kinase)